MNKKIILAFTALLLLATALVIVLPEKKQVPTLPNNSLRKLGHYLFFDNRLSFNNTKSCASCHAPQFAFTDGYRRSTTATGDNVLHNAPSLLNIVRHTYFDWANYTITTLSQQHQRPLFNTTPVELGAKGNETLILNRLQKDTLYQRLFKRAFPTVDKPINFDNIMMAIADYVSTLQSTQAPFDWFLQGDSQAISPEARQGFALFNSPRLGCNNCHGGPYFTNATLTKNIDSIYFNTGLYNMDNGHCYPPTDNGIRALNGKASDDGRFKVPSLRNIALTAPYMHDGSVASLPEVLDIYMRGGRRITQGPLRGDGAQHPNKSPLLKGFVLSAGEQRALLAFLYTLTDSTLLTNPVFQNPFVQPNN